MFDSKCSKVIQFNSEKVRNHSQYAQDVKYIMSATISRNKTENVNLYLKKCH